MACLHDPSPLRPCALQFTALFLLFIIIVTADPIVTVRNGSYEGLYAPEFNQEFFLGIPYAQDTSGANRFRIPQALNETWTGVRTAKNYSNACPDPETDEDALYGMSEDCLGINIVRPAGLDYNLSSAKLPVIFWIHGGSYQVGTSGLPRYNLSYIVQRSVEIGRPVLAASINYRKGAWGNMYSIEIAGSGNTNLALRDMRQALAWVQENIEPFGGDKSRVTIWGESSGSFAVGQLLMTYGGRTDGLFHRSIQESGSAATAWYNGTEWYQPIYDTIVDQVNCTAAIDTLECLRTIPYETLYPYMQTSVGPGFYPTVDGDIMPNYPTVLLEEGRFAHVPHILGTLKEGSDNAPSGINTDDELFDYLYTGVGYGFPAATVRRIMDLYPDDPSQGIPLNTGTERFAFMGWQFKRIAAIVGDIYYHATRWNDARHYAKYNPNDTFTYRFNTRGFASVDGNVTATNASAGVLCEDGICTTLNDAYKGVAHATELAFVFDNPDFTGPLADYVQLGGRMADMWINFAHDGNPNANGTTDLPIQWPTYASGGDVAANLVLQTESQGGFYAEPDTYRLEGREYLTKWARRRHV